MHDNYVRGRGPRRGEGVGAPGVGGASGGASAVAHAPCNNLLLRAQPGVG